MKLEKILRVISIRDWMVLLREEINHGAIWTYKLFMGADLK